MRTSYHSSVSPYFPGFRARSTACAHASAKAVSTAALSVPRTWTFDPTMANPKRRWGSVYVVATK